MAIDRLGSSLYEALKKYSELQLLMRLQLRNLSETYKGHFSKQTLTFNSFSQYPRESKNEH